jgi:hypothetical protein
MKRVNKRSQITIFIIIAVVLVLLIALAFIFWPKIKIYITGIEPNSYIKDCAMKAINEAKEKTGLQGGSLEPENYLLYKDEKLDYLCYTSEYYKTCLIQMPLLKQHVEAEIENYAKDKVAQCVDNLKRDMETKGYSVEYKSSNLKINFEPNNLVVTIDSGFTATKGDSSQTYDNFKFSERSGFYTLMMIVSSIINWEARYGGSESTIYMTYYPNVKVQKITRDEGTAYLLGDRNTGEQFNFATRSLMWPAGYGIGEVK